jgi:ParB family chromosome partitioning protein|nr:MAG TPA: chromosome partitioning protein [Caudoviricetes sp.]
MEQKQIPIDMLRPHPDNPRKDLGDLTELAESIKARGVMQNLTVIPQYKLGKIAYYTILIGHRRCEASKIAGLKTLPCTVVNVMSKKEQIATMLLENMQRSDLTPLEQAEGFQMMIDLGEGIRSIEKKTGFSATTIWHRVKLLELDREELRKSQEREVKLTDYIKLEKLKNVEDKNECLKEIGTNNFDYTYNSKLRKQERKEKQKVIKKELEDKGLVDITDEGRRYLKYDNVVACDYANIDIDELIANEKEQLYFALSPASADWIVIYKMISKAVEDNADERERERAERKKISDKQKRDKEILKDKLSILENVRNTARVTVNEFVNRYTGNKGDENLLLNFIIYLQSSYGVYFGEKSKEDITNNQNNYAYTKDTNIRRVMLLYIRALLTNWRYLKNETDYDCFYDDKAEYKKEWANVDAYINFIGLLEQLGYQVADEERNYYNGTHEAFSKNDED